MKAKLLTISAAVMALLAVSCQREETGFGLPAGEEVTVTLSASVPTGGPAVKSDTEPGNGDQINRCILGVYMVTGENTTERYGTLEYVEVTGSTATFEDVTLLTGYDYKLVFWADNVSTIDNADLTKDNHYVTTDFPTVTYNTSGQYKSSDDTRDAFFGVFDLKGFSGTVEDSYTLTRPFGQLNIFTTDYAGIQSETLKPAKVQITFPSIPTGMNLLTGATISTEVTGTVSSIPTSIASPVVSGAQQLSFDYIFAPADQHQQLMLQNIKMTFYDASDSQLSIEPYTFPELPVRRNYRTNVSGALLTKSADLTIDIRKNFAGIKDVNLHEVSTIEEVEKTLNEIADMGANVQPESVVFTFSDELDDTEHSNTIELPALTTEVVLNFDGGISSTGLKVQDNSADGSFTGNVIIRNAGEVAVPLTIALPEGSATLDFGAWSSVSVSTADNSFILGEDVTISGTLTVNKGNVEIYGRVNSVDLQNNESIVTIFTVYDAELLKYAMTLALDGRCEKVVLGNDIELDGGIANAGNTAGREDIAFVLDLSGNKLSISHDKTLMNSSNGASVTIRNGDLSVMGVPSDKYTLCASDKGKITLEGLNYETTGGGVGVYPCTNGGEIYVKKCNINTSFYNEGNGTTGNGPAVMTTATGATAENTKDVLITIEDTHMESFSDAIIFNVNGRINIKNCTTKAQWHGLVLRGGTAVVENTVFTHDNHNDDPQSVSQGWYNEDWGDGNGQPRAAITVGNRGNGAYQYPSNLTLINTKAKVIGQGVNLFASMYVWANETPAYGVTITYDDATEFVGGDVIYGNDGKNITVNGKALDLSEQVFEVSNIEELLSKIQSLATSGGTLVIKEGADITLTGDMFSTPLAINKPTVIRVNGTLTSENPGFYLKNNSTLKIEGSGNVKFNSKIVFNYGMLTVTGGSYLTDDLDDGCVFGNVEETAVMILNDVTVNASRFAVAGRGRIEINGGVISSISCNWRGKFAYCVRAEGGGEMTIRDAEVNGIQGCIASIEGSHILLDNVRAYAKNTEGRTDAWYALYPASLGVIEVLSGEYYSDRTPCCYASDDDIELNPIGRFIFKGGKYSSMPKVYNKSNETTSDAVAAPGYKFQQISDGSEYKYEVVPQQ